MYLGNPHCYIHPISGTIVHQGFTLSIFGQFCQLSVYFNISQSPHPGKSSVVISNGLRLPEAVVERLLP